MLKGSVLGLFKSIKGEDGRISFEELCLDENGIIGDKYYGKKIDRSILITSKSSYDLAKDKATEIPFGYLGENIVIDINPYSMKPGEKIEMGEVVLEITNNCTICNSLGKVDSSLPELLANDRGIFAKTIKGGYIRKGDIVKF
ncbi:MOSC domain-containing protein [Sulfurimonas sp.]|uniref:MOSC domain-containing protein n=1 Tax=Sulfurimonas sp. TaxID=2022749 RepID=UPI0035690A93